MKEQSAAREDQVYNSILQLCTEWAEYAADTRLTDFATEYLRSRPVEHTSNQWVQTEGGYHTTDYRISNMVYLMYYQIYENTHRSPITKKGEPISWHLSWNVRFNYPKTADRTGGTPSTHIAGQDRKSFSRQEELDKYLRGRIDAYAHLFLEISPSIPAEYKEYFSVRGQLLPGYRIKGDDPHLSQRPEIESSAQALFDLLDDDMVAPPPPQPNTQSKVQKQKKTHPRSQER